MTQLDVMYRYNAEPSEAAMVALGRVREVYGIRRVDFKMTEKTVRVEYDSTRLSEATVHQLLRRTGLDVIERVSLLPPQPESAPVAA